MSAAETRNLEEWGDALEEQWASEQWKADKELTSLLSTAYELSKKKSDFFLQVKNHPSVAAHCTMGSAYGTGFKKCLKLYAPNKRITKVALYSGLGSDDLFVDDRAGFVSFLNESIAKARSVPKKPTPAKVVAKMVALRIKRALNHAKVRQQTFEYEKAAIRRNLSDDVQQSWAPNDPARQAGYRKEWEERLAEVKDYPKPDLTIATKTSLEAWVESCREPQMEHTWPVEVYADLVGFIARPDVTEEMIRMACDMILVDEVIES
jgi:hypothetical protein